MNKKIGTAIDEMINEYKSSVELLEVNQNRHSSNLHKTCCQGQSAILWKLRDLLASEQRELLIALDRRAFG